MWLHLQTSTPKRAFIQYLGNCLKVLSKENNEIYLCCDFNIDLLKIEVEACIKIIIIYYVHLDFFYFIQPTRIVENQTPSVIDNIFSNNINEEITAGNH